MLLLVLLSLLSPANCTPTSFFSSASAPPASDEPGEELGSPEFWYKLVVSIGLVLAGGVFAGYTPITCPSFNAYRRSTFSQPYSGSHGTR